jgi:asparagine synthase (glutamine-hydrolysing)
VCGIVGMLCREGASGDGAALERMREAIAHRGPDDAGAYRSPDGRVLLGHRRLSIVDLSPAGHQPMSNEDGTVWLTFNGEIYNHADLRPALEARGHRFRSRTDSEVIIHLYEEEGVDCLARLDGMFALALWDEQRGRLLLARDRLGKKPLYHCRAGSRLLFASEIKALLAHPDVSRDLDVEALDLYLTFSNVPPPRTLFAGISKLPAAHRLVVGQTGTPLVERYWSPIAATPWDPDADEAACAREVALRLRRAVRKRMMSDVPLGAFLSGGVDSSATVALMSELVSRPLDAYSVGFEGFGPAENFHDLPFARDVARRFGCNHHEVTVTADDCRAYLPELVHDQDEPIADAACLPMHFLCRRVRQDGVKVVLVGEGSDEVFGGYDDMAHLVTSAGGKWDAVRRLPGVVRAALHRLSRLTGAPAGRIDLLRRARVGEPLYWGLDVAFWQTEKAELLTSPPGGGALEFAEGVYADLAARQPGADLLQQMSALELANRLPELLLMRVDKISMSRSIEARAPFLDADLVSFGLSLPQRLKIPGPGRTKHILKQALRGVLPAAVLDRPKQGFRVPLPEWLRGPLAGWARRQVLEGTLASRGLLRTAYIERLWQRHQSGRFDHSYDLWNLINLGAWYERWIQPRAAA